MDVIAGDTYNILELTIVAPIPLKVLTPLELMLPNTFNVELVPDVPILNIWPLAIVNELYKSIDPYTRNVELVPDVPTLSVDPLIVERFP